MSRLDEKKLNAILSSIVEHIKRPLLNAVVGVIWLINCFDGITDIIYGFANQFITCIV